MANTWLLAPSLGRGGEGKDYTFWHQFNRSVPNSSTQFLRKAKSAVTVVYTLWYLSAKYVLWYLKTFTCAVVS